MRSADCLDERTLQELAAGIAPQGGMEQFAEHLIRCEHCASLLQRYLYEFADELTPEEAALLAQLESSTPQGQDAILQRMLGHVDDEPKDQREN